MKILQILRAPVGGLFRHVSDLAKGLDGLGHEVGLVVDELSHDRQTQEKLNVLEPYAKLGIHKMAIPRLLGPADIITPLKIRGLLSTLNIDVVHGHGAKGGFHARLGALGLPAKAFYTPHGGALHFSAKSPAGLIFHSLEKALVGASSKIIFESAYAQRTYNSAITDVGPKGIVIHNGLDDDEFKPVPNSDDYDFVFVGELRDLKGVSYLLKALVPLVGAGDRPATLLVVGDGPHRAQFEAETAALGLNDRVTFVGAMPAMAGFKQSNTVVVPSLKESLPYIVLEAIAAHKNIVTTNVGGIPEIFGPAADQLVPPSDVGALEQAMAKALGAHHPPMQSGNALFDHVRENFSTPRMVEAIQNVYDTAK